MTNPTFPITIVVEIDFRFFLLFFNLWSSRSARCKVTLRPTRPHRRVARRRRWPPVVARVGRTMPLSSSPWRRKSTIWNRCCEFWHWSICSSLSRYSSLTTSLRFEFCSILYIHVSFVVTKMYGCFRQVPLSIFKREKEIARNLEFDGLYIADQPSDDDIKGHWDKLVISTRSAWTFFFNFDLENPFKI